MEVFREAKRQGAFVFYNHPQWTNQQKNGLATLHEIHKELLAEGLLDGIEIVNWVTYSDESLQIALDNDLTILGNSDVHDIINWDYENEEEGHRPVTLVFASEKSEEALKLALEEGRSAVWFHNTLVGKSEFLAPLVQSSLKITRMGNDPVQTLMIENRSDADYILENLSEYTLHDHASVFILKAHETNRLQVMILENRPSFDLCFRVLNAFTAPGKHPEISLVIE